MKLLAAALILGLLIMHGAVYACSPAPLGVTEARSAETAFIGKVTRLKWVKPNFDLFVYATPVESLRGLADKSIKAQSPCSAPIELGQRVVVASWKGKFYVYPAKEYEDRFKEAFRYVHK